MLESLMWIIVVSMGSHTKNQVEEDCEDGNGEK